MNAKTRHIIYNGVIWLLVTLWVITICVKLYDIEKTRSEMRNQVFPMWVAEVLVWLIPAVCAGITILLLSGKRSLLGLKASLLLLCLFSLYIILGMNNAFGRIPCSCGSILPHGNYSEQLLLNGVFILLITITLYKKLNI